MYLYIAQNKLLSTNSWKVIWKVAQKTVAIENFLTMSYTESGCNLSSFRSFLLVIWHTCEFFEYYKKISKIWTEILTDPKMPRFNIKKWQPTFKRKSIKVQIILYK